MKKQVCWIPTLQDNINEASERRLLWTAAGYTRVDHIRKLTIRKEPILYNILHMKVGVSNWFHHREGMKEGRYTERVYLYTAKDRRRHHAENGRGGSNLNRVVGIVQ
jgi:hypothetical protein